MNYMKWNITWEGATIQSSKYHSELRLPPGQSQCNYTEAHSCITWNNATIFVRLMDVSIPVYGCFVGTISSPSTNLTFVMIRIRQNLQK